MFSFEAKGSSTPPVYTPHLVGATTSAPLLSLDVKVVLVLMPTLPCEVVPGPMRGSFERSWLVTRPCTPHLTTCANQRSSQYQRIQNELVESAKHTTVPYLS